MGQATIPAVVRDAAAKFGASEALVDGGLRLDFRELLEHVRTVARAFLARGIRPGDRVAVNLPNTHHWVLTALGALYAGATLIPVNTRFTAAETVDLLVRGRARALVVAADFLGADRYAAIRGTGADLPDLDTVVRVPLEKPHAGVDGTLGWAEFLALAPSVPAADAEARADAVRPDDVSDILFTSGTTGRSKGVLSAHRQVVDVAAAWAECGRVTEADRYLVINPFFHSFGYKAGIVVGLLTGAALVPQAVFDVRTTLDVIARERISVLPGAPTIFQSLLHEPDRGDTSSLRLAVTGAATVPASLVRKMRAELGFETVLTAYGLTEAVVVTMCRPGDDAEIVASTSGRATAGFSVAIRDGEILLRGPNVMLGYLDDPESTAKAIDSDGWLHTGDVGVLDDAGNLTITGRLKDMYICGGFNVYPAEVEHALTELPGVRDAAVVGVPDERMGEVGKAFVVGTGLTAEDVIAFCRERLANYKVPRFVEFLGELPRNASGKVLKRLLTEENA
ncbi:FadD3 family acyl-CoA ligase [Amycolatopsis thermophila]|uniref:Acyl-CoA synthetase (AMP-forming)/AMP-acid ligase II n=1 Tax=Amycolatopsis thermophila TaxID=206084 RepID=A0ABU0EZZ6_9PSEU|nr:FadD3 family acyl-CoA ligase [Amycolatopsis thermophila]MDQ0380377.1 acyl-CoA synthetase (AMP-forming)/AMP-acid ligase II [Amycolatopsis thermophila]